METRGVYRGGKPSGSIRGYTFNTDTGELLTIDKLVSWTEDTRATVNRTINQQIRTKNIPLLEKKEVAVRANQPFYLQPNGAIAFIFQKYEITPGSYGAPIFEVPLAWKLL